MALARRELLDSATSHKRSGENRLTELFATVLDANDALAHALMTRVGLEPSDRFEVRTQERVAPGCIPDMVIRAKRSGGGLVSQLWAEHKTVSGFRHEQREDYQRELSAAPGKGQLLTITVDPVDETPGPWQRLTWQEVGELIDSVGRDVNGDDWREAALSPTAPASERLLHELLWYFEREGFAVVRPLTQNDITVFKALPGTIEVLEALANRAADHIGDYVKDSLGADEGSFWFHVAPPARAWVPADDAFEGYCEVLICTNDEWSSQHLDGPAVGAGYTLDIKLHEALSANQEWLDKAEASGFDLEEWAGYTRCWRTRALSEFVSAGSTLDAQARELARWARDSIEALSALDPGPIEPETGQKQKAGAVRMASGE